MKENIELEKYINEVIDSIPKLSVKNDQVKEFIQNLYSEDSNNDALSLDFINKILKIYSNK